MHASFVKHLVDPETKEPLRLEIREADGDFIESGFLVSSTNRYVILRGIPRFVPHENTDYARSFGYQWQKWPRVQFESENIGRPMEGHTRRMWELITGITKSEENSLKDQVVVDIGCGPGRFVDVARSKGARVIGIDYSAAVEAAEINFKRDPNVCICQADALKLPFGPASIDGAFSIGVLHHTPDPELGIRQISSILRDGGWTAVCVYGKGGHYGSTKVQIWRGIFKALWPLFGHYPPLWYSHLTVSLGHFAPPLGKAIRLVCPFIKLPDRRWSLLDTFDCLTPSYQSSHESFEVFSWLKNSGFMEVEPTNWGPTSYRGTRKIALTTGQE